MSHRVRIAALAAGALLVLALQGVAATPEDYAALVTPKALAVSPDAPARVFGIASGQQNDLAASTVALRNCENRRQAEKLPTECEILRLNNERITPGRELLASLPEEPHPLYLWRYEGDRATVFLAGSIHLLKPSLFPLPRQYEQAYAASDHLVVEVNTNAYAPAEIQAKTLAVATFQGNGSLSEALPAPLYARLRDELSRYGLGQAAIDNAKPSLLMNQLVVARLLALGYLPEHGVEQHFLRKLGPRDVLELETLDSQLALLFEQPLPVQVQLLADTLDQMDGIEPILAGLLRAWLSGDDESLERYFDAQTGSSELSLDFMEALLDRRNERMAERISELLSRGSGTYFVVVGAAHHLGPKGIPTLLASQGHQGRRITSDTVPEVLGTAPTPLKQPAGAATP